MNDSQIKKIEKQLSKTHHVFLKNKKIDSLTRNMVSFMKGLSQDQAALLLVKVMVGVAPVLTRKKVHMLLKDDLNLNPTLGDELEFLLEEIYSDVEKPLKLKDLLQ
jgi:hypothetical protein